MVEFADLFTMFLSHEGPTPCWPMIMIMNNGKTNPFGHLEYMGGGGNALPEPITLYNGPDGILPVLSLEYCTRSSTPV